jgi:hypothetical protein
MSETLKNGRILLQVTVVNVIMRMVTVAWSKGSNRNEVYIDGTLKGAYAGASADTAPERFPVTVNGIYVKFSNGRECRVYDRPVRVLEKKLPRKRRVLVPLFAVRDEIAVKGGRPAFRLNYEVARQLKAGQIIHQDFPFQWVEDQEGTRFLSNGNASFPERWPGPEGSEFLPGRPLEWRFWAGFLRALSGQFLGENQEFARFVARARAQYIQPLPFQWITDARGRRWMTNGIACFPETRPEGDEWDQYKMFLPRAIEPRFWARFLAVLEGEYLDGVLGFHPFLAEAREKPLTDRQKRLLAIAGKMWKGGEGIESLAIGACIRFTVPRSPELGTAYVVDNPGDGAIYCFASQDEADAFARGEIRRLEIRNRQTHVDHVEGWEAEIEGILATVRAADFRMVLA